MYELTPIHTEHGRYTEPMEFISHSPLLEGIRLFLFGRVPDGRSLTTNVVTSIYQVHDNIWRFKTKSGSIYELKRI